MGDGILERYTGSYPKGTVLFEEGQPGDRMFVIRSGKVQIAKQVGAEQIVIALLGPGESVGEMAILDGQPRSATATVVEDSVLVELDGATFETLIRESGEIAVRIMRKLSQRLRDANRQIESFLDHNGAVCAIKLLRGLAGAERDGWRLLPLGTGPATLSTCAGLPPGEAQGIWERLRAIGLVAEQPAPRLASEPQLDEYLAYLDLKQRYDPLSVRELSEVTGLPEDEVHQVVRRLLASRLEGQGKLVDPYQHFLSLKKRFEYLDRV